jgi:hypothetical protein
VGSGLDDKPPPLAIGGTIYHPPATGAADAPKKDEPKKDEPKNEEPPKKQAPKAGPPPGTKINSLPGPKKK